MDSRSDSVLNDYSRCRRLGCCQPVQLMASSHHSLQVRDRLDRQLCWMAELPEELVLSSCGASPATFFRATSQRTHVGSLVSGFVGGRGGAESLAVVAFQFVRELLQCQVTPVIGLGLMDCNEIDKKSLGAAFVRSRSPSGLAALGTDPRSPRD